MAEIKQQVDNGKTIAVCGAKGGIGRTLISVNLAIALSKKNLNVNLLDADFQFGDVSVAMDLQPSFTMKDVVGELKSIDESSINNYLTAHSSGVSVLPSPERPEFAELVTTDALLQVVDMLRKQSDYLVVDTGMGIQEQTLDVLEQADQILVVTNLEMTALKSTRLMLETLEKLGIREKVILVVNRYDMDSLIKAEDVPDMLGSKDTIFIPNDFKSASQSLNLGIPLVISRSKSNLSKAFFRIAEKLISNHGVSNEVRKSKKRSKLFSRKK
ncbi:CpaE family protein [Virgibacillus byunsanensis]|uniref:CpaE family protein n=1 Tax=Virgibacillus byunsanensis TaxID=570945 RepID=A0ABW3LGW2_9BACI